MNDDGMTTIGLLHPGSMGSSIGAATRASGARVIWASDGRSEASKKRAEQDDLEDVDWLNAIVNQSKIILSICPPENAVEVAEEVFGLGFRGIYVDANAIAPDTSRHVAGIVDSNNAKYVDGGIIGGPARKPGSTRLYLAGSSAEYVSQFMDKGDLGVVCIEDAEIGAASALKMAYSAWTKGSSALLTNVLALAISEGVDTVLIDEWKLSQKVLLERTETNLPVVAAKAWRFVGEMLEMAKTFEANDLPPGFHQAAAEVYTHLVDFKDDPEAPGGLDLAKHLLD